MKQRYDDVIEHGSRRDLMLAIFDAARRQDLASVWRLQMVLEAEDDVILYGTGEPVNIVGVLQVSAGKVLGPAVLE